MKTTTSNPYAIAIAIILFIVIGIWIQNIKKGYQYGNPKNLYFLIL